MSTRRGEVTPGLGQRLVRALSIAASDDAAGAAVLAEVARELGAPLAVLWLFDAETGLLHWSQDWSDGDEVAALRQVERRLTFVPGVGLPGRVLESGEPAWIEDVATDANFPRADVVLQAGLRSAVGAPLLSPEGPVGVIEFFGRTRRVPSREQLDDVAMAGAQLAAYLARRRIEDRLRASEERSAAIVRAALDCIITMDHHGRVLDFNPAAEETFGYTRESAIGQLLADLIIPPELRDAHRRALARYVENRTPTILGRRLELVGLRADGSTFPVELTVTQVGVREPPVFAGFVRDITERRAAEEQIARTLERERQVAQALQHSLLPPRLPAIAGLELGADYRGGTAGWEVGGDFYDVFKLGSGRWALAIGDVCGKGPSAAALAGIVRYALRLAAVREDSPSAVLEAINDELLRNAPGEFCTLVFATVDVEDAGPRLRMAVGGHPLPLLARTDGSIEAIGRPGTLLGVVRGVQREDTELSLRPGELLLLYTDGLTEARTADGRFGEARLTSLLADRGDRDPQALVEHLDATLLASRVHGSADDVALLAVAASA
jgi:PAS domain S-box-containing protein